MNDGHDHETAEAERRIDEALDELAGAAALGVARAPKPEREAAPPPEEEGHHEHMERFPMFIQDEKGQIVEVDPREISRYECDEEGCDDPSHDHSARDHGHEHGEHEHHEHEHEGDKHGTEEDKPEKRRSRRSS